MTVWASGRSVTDASGRPVRAFGVFQDISMRKSVEAALLESEDHYRHAVDLNPQIPWTADPRGNVLEVGPRWNELVSWPREESLGTGWVQALHPDDLAPVTTLWERILKTGEPGDIEYRLRHPDGGYRWFRVRAAARRDEDGNIVRWYGSTEDVHQRREAVEALRSSEAFAQSVLQSSTDCVKVLDLEGRLQFMNRSGFEVMEVEDFELVRGRELEQLWPATMQGQIRGAVESARQGRTTRFIGFCTTLKDTPKWWDVSFSPILGSDGRPARLLAVSRDVTAAKKAECELDRARQEAERMAARLGKVLDSTTDSVFTVDRSGAFTFLNPRAEKILPGGRELIGKCVWDVFPGEVESDIGRRCRDAAVTGRMAHFESYSDPLGIWCEVHAYPSDDGLSIFFRDITERHLSHEKLQRSQEAAEAASRAKSEFLATVSHEIRTPMNGVLGMAEQLALTGLDDEQQELLDALHSSSEALLSLIEGILHFSRIEAGKLSLVRRPTDLRDLAGRLRTMFHSEAFERNLELSVRVDETLDSLHLTDPDRLQQILSNMIGNAVKFTEAGSVQVRISAAPVGDGRQSIRMSVEDTGIGIGAGDLDRIFRTFEQADASTSRLYGGTGLGLAISRRLAQALGGDIAVESTLGRGSTFTLMLDMPVVVTKSDLERPVAAPVTVDLGGTRVMVAEDNRVNARILQRILEKCGCDVTLVANGASAIASAREQRFDMIFMDISMPGVDGLEAAAGIRAAEAETGAAPVPIVAITAHVGDEYRSRCDRRRGSRR